MCESLILKSGTMNTQIKDYTSFFGFPVAVIAVCRILVKLLLPITAPYTWVPGMFIYWFVIFSIVYFDSKKKNKSITSYLKRTNAKVYLVILALVIGCLPLPIFILNIKLMNNGFFILSWLFVAMVNPFFEEIFWRGYMLEHEAKMPFWIKSTYASLLFTLSHVFIWGIFSTAMLTKELIVSVFIMGLAWSLIYRKSKSIVLPYFSHMLVDIFNLSVLAMMNLLPIALHH
jgi:hypothetical protein